MATVMYISYLVVAVESWKLNVFLVRWKHFSTHTPQLSLRKVNMIPQIRLIVQMSASPCGGNLEMCADPHPKKK